MAARLLRAILLVAVTLLVSLYFLYGLHSDSLSQPNHLMSESSLTCLLNPGPQDCASIISPGSIPGVVEDAASVPQDKPTTLEYPPGFEHFDTSNPESPYNQDRGSDKSHSESDTDAVELSVDSDSSYWNQIFSWVPYNARYNVESFNPVIWQTYREEPGPSALPYKSWLEKNKPKWTRHFLNDDARESLIASYGKDLPFLQEVYNLLPAKILKLDFLRYLSLYKDGGVFADIDTQAHMPIDDWYSACYSDSPSRSNGNIVRSQQPGLIVGVEFDLTKDPRFETIDGQKVTLANYVFAANKGHPALAKAIHNIVQMTYNRSSAESADFVLGENYTEVYEWTGRKMWTDTIIGHVQETVKGFKERDLLGLKKAKVVDDICILPITAFGSGQLKYKNSPESNVPGVMVKHFSMHMWNDI